MKKTILILVFLFLYSCSKPHQLTDNYSFIKLCVLNEKTEIMLINWEGSWEIPGQRYTGSKTLNEFVSNMGNYHGILVDSIKLRGLFTFHYNTKPNPTLMHYYTAKLKSGELIKFKENNIELKWFSLNDAFNIIPYEEMVTILYHIFKEDNTIWAGAFEIIKKAKDNKRFSKIKEPIYQL